MHIGWAFVGNKNYITHIYTIIRCVDVLFDYPRSEWILELYIKSCFEKISHNCIMKNIPIDMEILYKFIKNKHIVHNCIYNFKELIK